MLRHSSISNFTCRNLTAADIIDHNLGADAFPGKVGKVLLQDLQVPKLTQMYDGDSSTELAAMTMMCLAHANEDCVRHEDKEAVCSEKLVDYFPFVKNNAIQKVSSLYMLTIDEVCPSTSPCESQKTNSPKLDILLFLKEGHKFQAKTVRARQYVCMGSIIYTDFVRILQLTTVRVLP